MSATSIGLPKLKIAFEKAAQATANRAKKGYVGMIVRDAKAQGLHKLVSDTMIPTELGVDNQALVKLAFEGSDRGTPSLVYLVVIATGTEDTTALEGGLKLLESVSVDYLAGPADVTEDELLAKVRELNEDDDVDGFIVQLPLPKHISEQKVIETIDYRKDVDGFHPINVGRMSIGLPCYVSATPNGILELLKRYRIETSGKKCVVLGRSNIVGKPMAALMMQKAYPGDATVTVCHSRSKDLVKECREADIIIAALGQPNFVKAEMVKEGAVVIDVGTTRVPDASKKSGFKLTGDVKFDEVSPKCSFITPVPGGVGPMTIVSLMKNTLLAGKKAIYQ